jgi:glycosyltransferase involved in cell wall biosynthesis
MTASRAPSPAISIITACYNSTPFLNRLYGSLARQTYRNFEWICVDDCSTDDTVDQLLELDPPGELGMQVFRLPQNTGGPVALAVGTERARCEIVVWLDHDDELFPFALEEMRSQWPQVAEDESLVGLVFRAVNPVDETVVGGSVPARMRFRTSSVLNQYPQFSDGTGAIKLRYLQPLATVENMENVSLGGVIMAQLSRNRDFLLADSPPIRFYHRDNPASQTRMERISRKTVASYARIIDGADRYFILKPIHWVRHIATMLRYSKLVHGAWFEGLKFVNRSSIRFLVRALLPLGWLAYRRRPRGNVVEIPFFRPELASGLVDLKSGLLGRAAAEGGETERSRR